MLRHLTPHSGIMYLIDAVILLLVVVTAIRVGRAVAARRRPAAEYIGNQPVFVSSDDDTLTEFQKINRERRRESIPHDTMTLAQLAAEPSVLATLEDEEVITGTIVAVDDVPGPAPAPEPVAGVALASDDERVQGIYAVLHEIETQWHNLGSGWEPAAQKLRTLDADDWLYQLLTEPVPA